MANLYYIQGLYSQAEPLFKETKKIYGEFLGKESPLYVDSLEHLLEIYKKQGKNSEAEAIQKEILEIKK